jgi:hypothetical protein
MAAHAATQWLAASAPITPSPLDTPSGSIVHGAPSPSSPAFELFETPLPSTPIADRVGASDPLLNVATDLFEEPLASETPPTALRANRRLVLGPAQSLSLADDAAARRISLPAQLGLARSAFTPDVLLTAPDIALSFDAARPPPSHAPTPFDIVSPPSTATAPAASSTSSLLAGSGGAPGAASPLQLSLLLLTAWRSLGRPGTLRPASIALPSLAPPG